MAGVTERLPDPPDEPHPDECCSRGCYPCIFDYYEEGMERWRGRIRALGHDPDEVLARVRAARR